MSDWRDRAACLGKPEGFFPDESHLRDVTAAKKLCAGCDVSASCLAAADPDDKWSILGGLEAGERRRLAVRTA